MHFILRKKMIVFFILSEFISLFVDSIRKTKAFAKGLAISQVFLSSLFILLFLGACSQTTTTEMNNSGPGKERQAPVNEQLEGDYFQLLQQASNDFLQHTAIRSIMPKEVYEKLVFGSEEEFLIVDVRDVEAFAIGNIQGSINIPYANTADLNYIEHLPKNKELIIICYSGHTAAQTAALWNMLGYNAVSMEYGMGGWNSAEGLGAPFVKQPFDFIVSTDTIQANQTYATPTIEETEIANLNELIMKQSSKYLASDKKAVIAAPAVLEKIEANASDIFLLDVREEQHYQKGHVPNAINIPINKLASLDNLAKLPTDKQIIVIGYKATDASIANRVLNQLGYDAVAMHSGMRVWTSDLKVTGTTEIPVDALALYPVANLNYNLSGEAAEAG